MNCGECLEFMWQYLDGELDQQSSGELLKHLEQCRECFSHAEFERQLKDIVRRSCGRDQAPPGLRERLSRLLRMF